MKQPLPLASAPLVALFVGCILTARHSQTTAVLPDSSCPQSSEFGNTGCFEVRGQVIGTAEQALAGIAVDARPRPSRAQFTTAYVTTDATGHFRARQLRMFGAAPAAGMPDTISVYVVATDRNSVGLGVPPRIHDSVRVVVTIASMGAVPTPVRVRITLPVP